MNKEIILEKVKQFKELQIFIRQLEEEMEGIKQTVINEMTAQQVDEMIIDVFTIRYTTYTTNRIDSTTLKKEKPEIYDYYTKATEAKRFTVS
jgi:predicted phage-related endonuclease